MTAPLRHVVGANVPTAADLLRGRDQLIQECRRRHFANLPTAAAADAIARGILRMRASSWRRLRTVDVGPPHLLGRPAEFYFEILRICDRPLGAEAVRKVLANTR